MSLKGRIFSLEHRKKLSDARKGKTPWNKGLFGVIKQSFETIQKRSNSLKGRVVSEETRKKISEAQKGEKSHNWKGGVSFNKPSIFIPNFNIVRNPDYKYAYGGNSMKVLEIDKYRCIHCGANTNLIIHHFNKNKKDNRIENLITLCKSCHATLHNRDQDFGGKSRRGWNNGVKLSGTYLFTLRNEITKLITGRQLAFNLVPTVGRVLIANNLTDATPTNTMLITHAGLGTGSTAPANADTQLATETYRNAIASLSNSNNIGYATAFYTATEVTGTFNECGIFCNGTGSANSGILLSRVLLSPAVTKSATDSLTIDWELTIS